MPGMAKQTESDPSPGKIFPRLGAGMFGLAP